MGIKELLYSKLLPNELKDVSDETLFVCYIDEKTFVLSGNIVKKIKGKKTEEIIISWEEGFQYIEGLKSTNHIKKWEEILSKNKQLTFKLKIKLKEQLWVKIKIKPFMDENNKIYCYCGYITDITKEIELENLIKSLISDDLHGQLPTKDFMKSVVNNYLIESDKNKIRGALILVNINDFKHINDSYGFEIGDLFLSKVADRVLEYVKVEDLVCRYSCDEFIIFKSDIDSIQEIEDFAKVLQETIKEPFIVNGNSIQVTARIGASVFPDNGKSFSELHRNADVAMNSSNLSGHSTLRIFDEKINNEAIRLTSIQEGLKKALSKNEMFIVFQPKVYLETSYVNGFEALLRWNSSEIGNVTPNHFIPIAEKTKEIIPIGKFVLEEVFKKIRELLKEGYDDFKVAVNFSDVQLTYGTVLNDLIELSEKYKVSLRYIEMEITESTLMKSISSNKHKLEAIKYLGVSIALDDFGTGYSSLNYLTKLPIDVLKIDRSFLVDLMENRKSECIIENIVNLSHELGMYVVAEGVEEKEQVEYLKRIRCDSVQGFYYSKPEKFEDIKSLLNKEIVINA